MEQGLQNLVECKYKVISNGNTCVNVCSYITPLHFLGKANTNSRGRKEIGLIVKL